MWVQMFYPGQNSEKYGLYTKSDFKMSNWVKLDLKTVLKRCFLHRPVEWYSAEELVNQTRI